MGLIANHTNKKFPPVIDYEEVIWTPKEIKPIMWLDPSQSHTMVLADEHVTQIRDMSGGARDAAQSVAAKKPAANLAYNSLKALSYDGGDCLLTDSLFNTSSAACTVFAVVDHTTGGTHAILSTRDLASGGWTLRFDSPTTLSYFHVGYAAAAVTGTAGKSIVGFIRNGLSCTLDFNGKTNTTTLAGFTASSFGYTAIGAEDAGTGSLYAGGIGEIVCVNYAMSDADVQKLRGYLAHKWELVSTLPNHHPYKNLQPKQKKELNYFTTMNLEGR